MDSEQFGIVSLLDDTNARNDKFITKLIIAFVVVLVFFIIASVVMYYLHICNNRYNIDKFLEYEKQLNNNALHKVTHLHKVDNIHKVDNMPKVDNIPKVTNIQENTKNTHFSNFCNSVAKMRLYYNPNGSLDLY